MVTESWVASKLNPYARAIKLGAILLLAVGLFAAGWQVNGWRLGAQIERKEAARQTALTARQAKAMGEALEAVTAAQARLAAERKANAALVAKAAQEAPTAPAYDCRKAPLPETYLETFRQ